MFEHTGRFHRVPVGFGPAPTPRQDSNGKPYGRWAEANTTAVGVTYVSDRGYLNSILPDGYLVDEKAEPTVIFEVMELRNLPWLNGRGYNTWGVYINNVICSRSKAPVKGSYMAVLFESFTDPITTGREELGFSKLWAEIPDAVVANGLRTHTASWFGKEFMRLEIPHLEKCDPSASPALGTRSWGHPQQDGCLHHRYVPSVGKPGFHDASYATYMPVSSKSPPVLECEVVTKNYLSSVKIEIAVGTWEELPTLWNVVEGLRNLPKGEIKEVSVHKFQGASDCSSNRRIEY